MNHPNVNRAIVAVCLGLLLCHVAGCCVVEAKQARERRAIACDPFFGFRPTCWNTHLWPYCCPCPPQATQPGEPGSEYGNGGRENVPTRARADEPIPAPPPAPADIAPPPEPQPPATKAPPVEAPLPKAPLPPPAKTSNNVDLQFRTTYFDPRPNVQSADAAVDMAGGGWAVPASFVR